MPKRNAWRRPSPVPVAPRAPRVCWLRPSAWSPRAVSRSAITAWLAAASRYSASGHLDAALDTCLRALLADSGSPAIHLELSRLYFMHGWHQRAVDHLLLLDKLLRLEPNAEVRGGVSELAAQYGSLDTRLEALTA